MLGDWYANILLAGPQVIRLVSEKSLLPIVIRAAPISALVERLIKQLAFMLRDLTVPNAQIMVELNTMQTVQVGKSVNRSVVRWRDDYMWRVDCSLHEPLPPPLEKWRGSRAAPRQANT